MLIGILTADLRDEISYWEVILAAIFIIVVLYFRQGLMGFVEPLFERLVASLGPKSPSTAPTGRPAREATGFALDDVRVRMGQVRILEGLDLAIDRPGIYCLIGPNGAGKDLLLQRHDRGASGARWEYPDLRPGPARRGGPTS